MKAISIGIGLVAILFSLSCHSKLASQKIQVQQIRDHQGSPMLLGAAQRESLMELPYASWFAKNYADYVVDSGTCNKLKMLLQNHNFQIFMGTWCSDSRREVPRMYKILDYCGVRPSHVHLVLLGNADTLYKQSPGHEEQGLELHRVPDLLIYAQGKEIGRIVEEPVVSLEKDLLSILQGNGYSPSYRGVSLLSRRMLQEPPPYSEKQLNELASVLGPICQSASELNTYGYVKMAAGEMAKAEAIFKLNLLLYPQTSNVFDSMGEYYENTHQPGLAMKCYQKELQLEPGNKSVQKKLDQLRTH